MRRKEAYLVFALAIGACGGETEGDRAAEEPPADAAEAASEAEPGAESGYTVVDVTDGGTIRGTVRFVGAAPPAQTVPVTEDVEACGESRQVQAIEVGQGGGLANAAISLLDISRGAALERPASPPVLDQRDCLFTPHILLTPAGATVEIANSDPITHNVHTVTFENRPVNRAQPKEVTKIEVTFPLPEKVKVKCDIHDWMGAWIVVAEHPYHAVTGPDGAFTIADVPPGTYTLEVWHETLGASTQAVTVVAGETTDVVVERTQG